MEREMKTCIFMHTIGRVRYLINKGKRSLDVIMTITNIGHDTTTPETIKIAATYRGFGRTSWIKEVEREPPPLEICRAIHGSFRANLHQEIVEPGLLNET
jgi:hypothetical protein